MYMQILKARGWSCLAHINKKQAFRTKYIRDACFLLWILCVIVGSVVSLQDYPHFGQKDWTGKPRSENTTWSQGKVEIFTCDRKAKGLTVQSGRNIFVLQWNERTDISWVFGDCSFQIWLTFVLWSEWFFQKSIFSFGQLRQNLNEMPAQ